MSSFTRGARVQRASQASGAAANAPAAAAASTTAPPPAATPNQQANTSIASSSPVSASVPVPAPVRPSGVGCRSWIHGLTLTSTGVSGLDSILGGGVALGSIVVIKDTTPSDAACTPVLTPFTSSFIADGIGYGQRVLYVTSESRRAAEGRLSGLPRNTTLERRQQDAKEEEQALKESAKEQEQLDLKIAWRYAHLGPALGSTGPKPRTASAAPTAPRSVTSATLSAAYDYHNTIASQLLQANMPEIISIQDDILPLLPSPSFSSSSSSSYTSSSSSNESERTTLLYRHTLSRIHTFLHSSPPGSVSRIFLDSFGSLGWSTNFEAQQRCSQLFLAQLRQTIAKQGATIVMMAVECATMNNALVRSMTHYADISLSVSGFSASAAASAKVLGDYDGLIRLERAAPRHSLVPSSGIAEESAGSSAASGNCFLYKLTRRKIVVEKFALPPEVEEEAETTKEDTLNIETSHTSNITTRGAAPVRAKEKKIEYDASDDGPSGSLLGAGLTRHQTDPTASAASRRQVDAPLHAILQGRSSVPHAHGCSNSHQMPGHKMDF